MTIGTQPAALPIQLDAGVAVTPGVPASDLFGGLIAALATAVAPAATAETAVPAPELPTLPAAAEGEAAPAEAADQLIALTCAMPAQAQLLVRKPGQPIEGKSAESDQEGLAEEEQPAPCPADVPTVAMPLAGIPVPPPAPKILAEAPAAAPKAEAPAIAAATVTLAKGEVAPEQAKPVTAPPATAAPAPLPPELARLLQRQAPEPLRAMLAEALPATLKPAKHGTNPAPLAPELKIAASTFTPANLFAPEIAPRADAPLETAVAQPQTAELLVEHQLDLASGDEWLDQLAKDIARSAGDTPLRFRLNPENLGSLRVEIANDRGGTAVRLTADTEAARAIIAEAQPRLLAEARAQGLRISEAHVDLGQQPGSDAQRRHAEASQEPQIRTARSVQEDGPSDGKPTRADAERYA